MRRRRELAGAAEAWEVRCEEAFWGRMRSAWDASARPAACRLRWGKVSFAGGGVVGLGATFCAVIELFEGIEAPLLGAARAFSSKILAEKYSARNRGVVPVTVALRLEALEKFLVTGREGVFVFAVCRRLDRHTVLRPLDRKALVAGYRIIIARCCYLEAIEALEIEVLKLSYHFCGSCRLANQGPRIQCTFLAADVNRTPSQLHKIGLFLVTGNYELQDAVLSRNVSLIYTRDRRLVIAGRGLTSQKVA
jgi:hypothetical protein